MTKIRHIGLIAALSIGVIGAAHAQDSAVIDATATINDPVVPVSVSAEQSISFGAVNKPIAELGGRACYYSLGVTSPNAVSTFYQAVPESGANQTFAPGNPTLGCDGPLSEGLSIGHFTVSCTPGVNLGLYVDHAVNPALAASIEMAEALENFTLLISEAGQQDIVGSTRANNVWTTCQGGALDVWVGATLAVYPDAQVGTEVNVGSVTLQAVYE